MQKENYLKNPPLKLIGNISRLGIPNVIAFFVKGNESKIYGDSVTVFQDTGKRNRNQVMKKLFKQIPDRPSKKRSLFEVMLCIFASNHDKCPALAHPCLNRKRSKESQGQD